MTSHGMATWCIQKLADHDQRELYLPELTSGKLAAVGFTEPGAGSDLSEMTTRISRHGNGAVVDGHKVWVTGASYADFVVVFGRIENGATAVVVPMSLPGVRVEPITDALGCRAAGHANIHFDNVQVPEDNILGHEAQSLPLIITTTLSYGRLSVAWGCVGILRACLAQAASHARTRRQFGKPLEQHQLIKRYLAELFVLEQSAAQLCEHASRSWDAGTPDTAIKARACQAGECPKRCSGLCDGGAGTRVGRSARQRSGSSRLPRFEADGNHRGQHGNMPTALAADHAMSLY